MSDTVEYIYISYFDNKHGETLYTFYIKKLDEDMYNNIMSIITTSVVVSGRISSVIEDVDIGVNEEKDFYDISDRIIDLDYFRKFNSIPIFNDNKNK